jgi:hypothetical protein
MAFEPDQPARPDHGRAINPFVLFLLQLVMLAAFLVPFANFVLPQTQDGLHQAEAPYRRWHNDEATAVCHPLRLLDRSGDCFIAGTAL